jgi:hypothetical protein
MLDCVAQTLRCLLRFVRIVYQTRGDEGLGFSKSQRLRILLTTLAGGSAHYPGGTSKTLILGFNCTQHHPVEASVNDNLRTYVANDSWLCFCCVSDEICSAVANIKLGIERISMVLTQSNFG